MGDALLEFKKKMSKIELKYKKEMAEADATHQKILAQTESTFKEALGNEKKKYDSLKSIHDQEVTDIFEDERTLNFIKDMRSYKKRWGEDKSVAKRKVTAAKMADATKNWVSSQAKDK